MKKLWILLVIAAVLFMWTLTRERFGPNDVEEPSEPSDDPVIKKNYSPSQVDAMYDMLSLQEKNDWRTQIVTGRNPKELIKKATSAFYWKKFINRTPPDTPVTISEIDTFIERFGLELQMDAFSRLTLRRVFEGKRYTPPPVDPAAAAAALAAQVAADNAAGGNSSAAPGQGTPAGGSSTTNFVGVNPDVEAPTVNMGDRVVYNDTVVEKLWNLLTPVQQTQMTNIYVNSDQSTTQQQAKQLSKMILKFAASDFYSRKYKQAIVPVTPQDVDSYLMEGGGEEVFKPYIRAVLLNYFKGPGSDPGPTSSAGSGSGSGSGGGLNKLFGPLFRGFGDPGAQGLVDSTTTNPYPELLGGRRKMGGAGAAGGTGGAGGGAGGAGGGAGGLGGVDLKGSIPTSGGLGSDANSQFFPYSRQPGDMDLIQDPYRVSQQFASSSYSFKTEPVPFLTDFSAFQR
jgi:hypothetical protein